MSAIRAIQYLLVVVMCSMTFPALSSPQETISLSYSSFLPSWHECSATAEEWCREIEKRTGGKVKFDYFTGGTLTAPARTYDAVVKGAVDVGFSSLTYTLGKFPLMEVVGLPLGYRTGMKATDLINALYQKFKPKEFNQVKVLYFSAHGPGILHMKRSVHTLAEMRGKKIRAIGVAARIVTALGGTPVGVSMYETYDALRTGVVDGSMAPYEALKGWKWGDVVSYTTQDYGAAYSTGFFVVMNKAKWNSLPPDVQKVFEEVSREWIVRQGKVWDEIDKEGHDFAKSMGIKDIPLSKEEDARWAARVRPLLDDYVKNTKAKGLPGDEALKFCLDYLKR